MNVENWVEIYNFPFLWFDAILYEISSISKPTEERKKVNEAIARIIYLQWCSISWPASVVIKQAMQESNRANSNNCNDFMYFHSQTNLAFDRTAQAIMFDRLL